MNPDTEFDLIETLFRGRGEQRDDVLLGVGDDCALLQCPPGQSLAVSLDTLVAGTHFLPHADPRSVGHKSLAVNLSDLAAMGAEPAWATLGLTLPATDRSWLGGFTDGFLSLARRHRVALVGGDTTRGPLAITVQAHGFVPRGQALGRHRARPGDRIFVTGTLGDAAACLRGHRDPALERRLHWPEPRVEVGLRLRGLAHAAIDLSDGLAGDLGHILQESGTGATLEAQALPLSEPVRVCLQQGADAGLPLRGGDDYELCFTAPPQNESSILALSEELDVLITPVGHIDPNPGLRLRQGNGITVTIEARGYEHFT